MTDREAFRAWAERDLYQAEQALHDGDAAPRRRPPTYTLRVTQVHRREDGEWRVAHRHGDTVNG